MKLKIFIIALSLFFAANSLYSQHTPVIQNNIVLKATGGFEVDSAYLAYEDGTPVPKGNITSLNKKIYLWIIINKGWKDIDGKINVGASQTIVSDKGVTILEEKNLFPEGSDEGSLEDARYISLNAVINSMVKKIPYFTVKYTVWDKNGTGKISGTYKFVVKE